MNNIISIMSKRIIMTMLVAFACMLQVEAQQYVVYGVTGKIEATTPQGKHALKLRETVYPSTVVNMPYGAILELIDTESRKQYTLRTPGKGKLETMITDRRNTVLKLTSKYFDYVLAQMKGSQEVVTRRVSDPATVTRDIAMDSAYVAQRDSLKAIIAERDSIKAILARQDSIKAAAARQDSINRTKSND